MKHVLAIATTCLLTSLGSGVVSAQERADSIIALPKDSIIVVEKKAEEPAPKKWYESIAIRGYVQARYNRLLETNSKLGCEQCDRSWGDEGGFFIRRMRIIFFGQISKRVYFYIQPDFASAISSTSLHFARVRTSCRRSEHYRLIVIDKNAKLFCSVQSAVCRLCRL